MISSLLITTALTSTAKANTEEGWSDRLSSSADGRPSSSGQSQLHQTNSTNDSFCQVFIEDDVTVYNYPLHLDELVFKGVTIGGAISTGLGLVSIPLTGGASVPFVSLSIVHGSAIGGFIGLEIYALCR